MSSIRLLDDITIQQIAAGEIIDRPAAIVKELIENSMDAGSNTITLEIKKGGKTYIRVTDNGSGIKEEDIGLAFERYSTSKLSKAEDLYNISSFGFRGEALASIASVARLELLTKTRNEKGSQSFIENGQVLSTEPVGCPNGTTLIINDIFYNFPVRKDFLKSDLVEANRITDTINRLAIGNPSISFKYIRDGKVIFKTPGKGDLMQAIYAVLGKEFKDNLIPVEYMEENLVIRGFISKNSFYRSNRSHQYLYVNNRFIKNNDIVSTVENEYKSLIPINRYPIFFLFIDLDSGKIDVNIHPTKEEINFINQEEVFKEIGEVVKKSLNESLTIQSVPDRVKSEKEENIPNLYESTFFEEEEPSQNNVEKNNKFEKENLNKKSYYRTEDSYNKNYNITSMVDKKNNIDSGSIYDLKNTKNFLNYIVEDKVREIGEDLITNRDNSRDELSLVMSNIKVLGIIFKTYILAEDTLNDELIMIDQHAAHERIMYEEYLKKYSHSDISTQMLMSPQVLELTDIEFNSFNENKDFFDKIGFIIDFFGGSSIIIRGTPIIFGNPKPDEIFYEVLDNLNKDISSPYEIKLDKIMKLACTSAIKSGDSIAELEIDALIEQLLETDNPFTCPHGRPTIVKVSKKQIEKDFKRIM